MQELAELMGTGLHGDRPAAWLVSELLSSGERLREFVKRRKDKDRRQLWVSRARAAHMPCLRLVAGGTS